jgi:GTP cyclohydrolase II
MNVTLGEDIRLKTAYGSFDVRHVQVAGSAKYHEGVVLQKPVTDPTKPRLVRMQSSCLFSESFWATDCDCALQMHAAMKRIDRNGGLLLYFYEEGRGAGLATKFKAIELQQSQGMDTKEAYECLSVPPDLRSYEAAAAVLKELLGNNPINLLTNNPMKANQLTELGVNVAKRSHLVCGWKSPQIRKYLLEKARILQHDIPQAKK